MTITGSGWSLLALYDRGHLDHSTQTSHEYDQKPIETTGTLRVDTPDRVIVKVLAYVVLDPAVRLLQRRLHMGRGHDRRRSQRARSRLDVWGNTPLRRTGEFHHPDVAALLEKHGAVM